MKKVMIFAGAGASRAVNPDNYPTTLEFFQLMPDSIKKNPHFQLVETYIREEKGKPKPDIEDVLWLLEELKNFCDMASRPENYPGYLLLNSRLTNAIGTKSNFGNTQSICSQVGLEVEKLIGGIHSNIYTHYGEEPLIKDVTENWVYLLNVLNRKNVTTDVITTNYDLVIEAALNEVRTESGSPYVRNGWAGDITRYLDLSLWENSQDSPSGLLTKLHGSVNWAKRQSKILIGASVQLISHDQQAIIYPGFKGAPKSQLFKTLHNYFSTVLATTDIAIFIGFAFRDEYINTLCEGAIRPGTTVITINPVKKLELPFGNSTLKHVHIDSGFSTNTVEKALRLIL